MAAKTDNRALQTAAKATTQKGAPPIPTILPAVETPQEKAAQRQPEGVHRTPASRPPRGGGVQTPQEKAAALPTTPMPGPVAGAPAIPTMLPTVPTDQQFAGAGTPTPATTVAGGFAPGMGVPGQALPPGTVPPPETAITRLDQATAAGAAAQEDLVYVEGYGPMVKEDAAKLEHLKDTGFETPEEFDFFKEHGVPMPEGYVEGDNPYDFSDSEQQLDYLQFELDNVGKENEEEKQAELDAIEQSMKLQQDIDSKAIMDRLSGMGGGGEKSVTFTLGVLAAKTNGAIAEAQATISKQWRDQEFQRWTALKNQQIQLAMQKNDHIAAEKLTKEMEQSTRQAEMQNLAETKPDAYIASLKGVEKGWDVESKQQLTNELNGVYNDFAGWTDEDGVKHEGHGDINRYQKEAQAMMTDVQIIGGQAFYGMPKYGTDWSDYTLEQKKRFAKYFNTNWEGEGQTEHAWWDPGGTTVKGDHIEKALEEWGITGYDDSLFDYIKGHGHGHKNSGKKNLDEYEG